MTTDIELYDEHRLPQKSFVPDKVLVKDRRPGLQDLSLTLVQSVDDAQQLLTWLGERRTALGVDTETSGLDPYNGELRLVQIGDTHGGWAIPWHLWGGVFIEAMSKYTGDLVMHNAAFDVRWLEAHSTWRAPWDRLHDTMIEAHIIDPTQSVALKGLSRRLVDKRADAGEQLLKQAMHDNKWTWATIPIEYDPYWAYGALDPVLTAHLHDIFRADKQYPRVYDLEMATRRVVSKMEQNGSPIDVEYCMQKHETLSQYVERVKDWGKEQFGKSITSTQQLAAIFTDLGAEITRTTKGGAPSVDKYMLRMLAQQPAPVGSLASIILDMRKADKLAGSYFKNFVEMQIDGILHPSIKTLGARTGRMSMTNPALQTLPKGEATVRDAFIPREGHKIVTCDYAQIEMRLMAHFAQDPKLQSVFNEADASGGDFFVQIGRDIYQDPAMEKSDKRRGLVKNTMYGKAYGAGAAKMAETAGVPLEQMQAVVDAFDSRYPGVRQFQDHVERVGQTRLENEGIPYILTPFGRRLPADHDRAYTLVNYLIQSHAAEVLKDALVQLDHAGYGEFMMLPVHDEVIFSIPEEGCEQALKEIPEIMGAFDDYAVPLRAEADGPLTAWGEKYRPKAITG